MFFSLTLGYKSMVLEAVDIESGKIVLAEDYSFNTKSRFICHDGHSLCFVRGYERGRSYIAAHFRHITNGERETCFAERQGREETQWHANMRRLAQSNYVWYRFGDFRVDVFNPTTCYILEYQSSSNLRRDLIVKKEQYLSDHGQLFWIFYIPDANIMSCGNIFTHMRTDKDHQLRWCSSTVFLDIGVDDIFRVLYCPSCHQGDMNNFISLQRIRFADWVTQMYSGILERPIPVRPSRNYDNSYAFEAILTRLTRSVVRRIYGRYYKFLNGMKSRVETLRRWRRLYRLTFGLQDLQRVETLSRTSMNIIRHGMINVNQTFWIDAVQAKKAKIVQTAVSRYRHGCYVVAKWKKLIEIALKVRGDICVTDVSLYPKVTTVDNHYWRKRRVLFRKAHFVSKRAYMIGQILQDVRKKRDRLLQFQGIVKSVHVRYRKMLKWMHAVCYFPSPDLWDNVLMQKMYDCNGHCFVSVGGTYRRRMECCCVLIRCDQCSQRIPSWMAVNHDCHDISVVKAEDAEAYHPATWRLCIGCRKWKCLLDLLRTEPQSGSKYRVHYVCTLCGKPCPGCGMYILHDKRSCDYCRSMKTLSRRWNKMVAFLSAFTNLNNL